MCSPSAVFLVEVGDSEDGMFCRGCEEENETCQCDSILHSFDRGVLSLVLFLKPFQKQEVMDAHQSCHCACCQFDNKMVIEKQNAIVAVKAPIPYKVQYWLGNSQLIMTGECHLERMKAEIFCHSLLHSAALCCMPSSYLIAVSYFCIISAFHEVTCKCFLTG